MQSLKTSFLRAQNTSEKQGNWRDTFSSGNMNAYLQNKCRIYRITTQHPPLYPFSYPQSEGWLQVFAYPDVLFHVTTGPWEFLNCLLAQWYILFIFCPAFFALFSRRVPQCVSSENLLDTEAPCSFSDCFYPWLLTVAGWNFHLAAYCTFYSHR